MGHGPRHTSPRRAATRRRALTGRRWWTVPLATALVAVACTSPPTTGAADSEEAGAQDEGAGQGEAERQPPECPVDALDDATGPVNIDLWFGGLVGLAAQTMEDMARRFNQSQDQVVVTASNQSPDYRETFRTFEAASAAGGDQLPDIMYVENVQLQAMIDSGRVLPAQACMEADDFDLDSIEPLTRATYTVGDVFYPGYVNISNPILYYNQAHWEQAGLDPNDPPETLEEVAEQSRALKEAGVSEKPFSVQLDENKFSAWLNGAGVDMVDNRNGRNGPPTEATLDTPQTRELLELLRDMNDEGLLNGFGQVEGNIDHVLAVVDQQSSMVIETSTGASTIAAALGGDLTGADVGLNFDPSALDADLVPAAGPFPGIDAPGQVIPGGGAFFMMNTSEPAEQAAAWRFLRFMLEEDTVKRWHLDATHLPILSEAQDDPELQRFWEEQLAGVLVRNGDNQLRAADPDRPSALIGPYPDYQAEVERLMEAVVLGGADMDSALAEAEANVTESLQRYAGE